MNLNVTSPLIISKKCTNLMNLQSSVIIISASDDEFLPMFDYCD